MMVMMIRWYNLIKMLQNDDDVMQLINEHNIMVTISWNVFSMNLINLNFSYSVYPEIKWICNEVWWWWW